MQLCHTRPRPINTVSSSRLASAVPRLPLGSFSASIRLRVSLLHFLERLEVLGVTGLPILLGPQHLHRLVTHDQGAGYDQANQDFVPDAHTPDDIWDRAQCQAAAPYPPFGECPPGAKRYAESSVFAIIISMCQAVARDATAAAVRGLGSSTPHD